VDNEKNDSGGARAATCVEFFHRFPSLFPFLLDELASITGYTVIADPLGTPVDLKKNESFADIKSAANINTNTLHPSLYPILLLISKFRYRGLIWL
jgi:hypothetical protein